MADSEQLVHKLLLALGVVGTTFGLVLIALVWWACRQCCRRSKSKDMPHFDSPVMIYCPSSAHLASSHTSPDPKIPYPTPRFSLDNRRSPITLSQCGGHSYSEYEGQTATASPTMTVASSYDYSQYTSSKDPKMASNAMAMNAPREPQPVHLQYQSRDVRYGSDPPLTPLLPRRSDTRPAKRHSSYTPARAITVSYYHAADSVVGPAPRPLSTIGAVPDLRFGGPKLGIVSSGEEGFSRRGDESV